MALRGPPLEKAVLLGVPAASHGLLLRIEIPTVGDPVAFPSIVEILGSSPASKKWKR